MAELRSNYSARTTFQRRGLTIFGLLTLISIAWATVGHAQQREPVGRNACSYLESPSLEETLFKSVSLEEQFNILRDLRTRMADLLPKQKLRVDERRTAIEKLKSERQSLDESSSRLFGGLPDSILKSQIDETEVKLSANRTRAVLPDISEGDKSKLEDEFQRLIAFKAALQAKLSDLTAETKRNTDRLKAIPQEINLSETEFQRENSCYTYLQDLNTRVEQKTIALLIPTSQKGAFRFWLSIIYAGIVSLMIGGFYFLAYKDVELRRTIFSQAAGIQFITLFSLVIAIILFGVLEILADKELAALLGGISGYILGHVTQQRTPVARRRR